MFHRREGFHLADGRQLVTNPWALPGVSEA
jgi:hypothetical protein